MGFFTGSKPTLKTFDTTQPWQREFGESLADLLGEAAPEMLRRVFEGEDRGDILKDFKTYFAAPSMRMWQDVIAPVVTEGFNLPGAFYSRSRFQGLQRSGEEFLTTRVNPLLFGALESSKQRELQRQAIIANIMTGSQSLATSPTIGAMMQPGSKSEFSQIAEPIAAGVAGAYLMGGFGGAGGGGYGISSAQYPGGSYGYGG